MTSHRVRSAQQGTTQQKGRLNPGLNFQLIPGSGQEAAGTSPKAQCAASRLLKNAGVRARAGGQVSPTLVHWATLFQGAARGTGTAWDPSGLKFWPRSTDNLCARQLPSESRRRGGETHTHTGRRGKRKDYPLQGPGVGGLVLFLLLFSHCCPLTPHAPEAGSRPWPAGSRWFYPPVLSAIFPTCPAKEEAHLPKIPRSCSTVLMTPRA